MTLNDSAEDLSGDVLTSRRTVLRSILLGGAVPFWLIGGPLSALAIEEKTPGSNNATADFDSFAQELKRWPESPSPLPTTKRSAQELTSDEKKAVSDMEKALNESSKKKKIDPRTHG